MLEPVGARVLVEDAPTQTRASGLIVPDYYDQIRMGIVIKVGDAPPLAITTVELAPGDLIYYPEAAEIKISDKKLIEVQHVLAVERME